MERRKTERREMERRDTRLIERRTKDPRMLLRKRSWEGWEVSWRKGKARGFYSSGKSE